MYSIQRPKLSTDPKYVEPGLGLPYLKMAATEDTEGPLRCWSESSCTTHLVVILCSR
jgi:hypothetical protein